MEVKRKQKQDIHLGMITVDRMNHEVSRILRKRIEQQAEVKLTLGEYVLIDVLSKKEDKVIQNNMAEAMGKDKSMVLRLVNSLEEKELIRRVECADDKRKNYLVITEKGGKVLEQYLRIEVELIDELKQGLTDNDMEILYRVTHRIKINAEKL